MPVSRVKSSVSRETEMTYVPRYLEISIDSRDHLAQKDRPVSALVAKRNSIEKTLRENSVVNAFAMHEWESEMRNSMRSTVAHCFPNFLKRFPCSKRSIISLASITKQ